jgi:hypothetical protein
VVHSALQSAVAAEPINLFIPLYHHLHNEKVPATSSNRDGAQMERAIRPAAHRSRSARLPRRREAGSNKYSFTKPTYPSSSPPSPSPSSSTTPRPPQPKPLLTPCHICHMGPKMKQQLENYTDCLRCWERMCFICARVCEEGQCGGRQVCSKCCVEVGEQGCTACFDCLALRQDSIMEGGYI